jgi:exopolysaccharide biosynthesis polyprenyl glycosylphosphotransferase
LYESAPAPLEHRLGPRPVARPQPVAPRQRRVLRGERPRLVAADALGAGLAGTLAESWTTGLVGAGSAVLALAALGLYRPRLTLSVLDDLPRTVLGVGAAHAAAGWLVPELVTPLGLAAPSPWWVPLAVLSVLAARWLCYAALRRRRRRGPGETALVVGTGEVAVRLASSLLTDRELGLTPVGFVGPSPNGSRPALPVPRLGPVEALAQVATECAAQHVVVAFPDAPDTELVAGLRACRLDGRTVFVVPRLFEMNVSGAGAELVEGVPLVRMRPAAPHLWAWRFKRWLDVAGAAAGLVLLAPVLLGCALAVRWETGRDGVLFRQERISRGGRPFWMMKFRSLTPSTEIESHVRWSVSGDARVGPVGRVLRRSSLDELPQLVNVLRGDMSLVGPRPERPYFVEKFRLRYARYADRHRVPAGLTGWAQIHGLRGDTSIEDRAAYDNYYIENWSLGLDLKIMLRTVVSIVHFGRG